MLPRLPRGRALDVACGQGRHALLLAGLGFEVVAVDWSPVAIEQLSAAGPSIDARQLDLEAEPLPVGPFQLVVVTRYLQRSLFPRLPEVLAPNGMLIYETRTAGLTPAFLLRPGELATAFPSLTTVVYREQDGLASLLAWRPSPP